MSIHFSLPFISDSLLASSGMVCRVLAGLEQAEVVAEPMMEVVAEEEVWLGDEASETFTTESSEMSLCLLLRRESTF